MNDATFRGRHYRTSLHRLSSAAYSCVQLAYCARPRLVGATGFVCLAKTERGLRRIPFGFKHACEVIGNSSAEVGVFDGVRHLEGAREMPVGSVPPAARVRDPSRHPVYGDRRQRVTRMGSQVDRLIDALAGALHLFPFQSGLSHTGDQVWQELAITDTSEMLGPFAEQPLRLDHSSLLQHHVPHVQSELSRPP